MLINDFDPTSLLEIQVNGSWVKVTAWVFRSWTGPRRIDGKPFGGLVCILGTNDVYTH